MMRLTNLHWKIAFLFSKMLFIKNLILWRRLCLKKQQKEFLLTNQNYF